MPVNLSIKNAPEDVVERLRARARRNHRSLQGELMAIIEAAASPASAAKMTPLEIWETNRKLGLPEVDEAAALVRADREGGHEAN
ncbi:MAG: Arc family DNA-binding protein [Pseudomonadota bacterium]|nr:Arc family DNA-binding protein [Pseudomonadota bacterium]